MAETKQSKSSQFEETLVSVPLLTVMLIILGVMKEIVYYNNYNLPIKYFLGLSELGLIISDDLLMVIPIIFLYLYIVFSIENNVPSLQKPISRKGALWAKILLLLFFTSAIIFFCFMKDYGFRVAISGFIIFLISGYIYLFHQRSLSLIFQKRNSNILFLFIATSSFMLLKTAYDISQVDTLHKYNGTLIKTTDSTYISTDSSYFIGKTDKYIFIYDQKTVSTEIIPSESIQKIIMKVK